MKLFDYTLLDDFHTRCVCVMKYLQFSLQQPQQGEWREVFCFGVNDVWLRSFTKHSFQYGPDEYLSISFTLSVCSEDYIINPRRRRITVRGRTDAEGTAGTN